MFFADDVVKTLKHKVVSIEEWVTGCSFAEAEWRQRQGKVRGFSQSDSTVTEI